jgi:hypothetical protein
MPAVMPWKTWVNWTALAQMPKLAGPPLDERFELRGQVSCVKGLFARRQIQAGEVLGELPGYWARARDLEAFRAHARMVLAFDVAKSLLHERHCVGEGLFLVHALPSLLSVVRHGDKPTAALVGHVLRNDLRLVAMTRIDEGCEITRDARKSAPGTPPLSIPSRSWTSFVFP